MPRKIRLDYQALRKVPKERWKHEAFDDIARISTTLHREEVMIEYRFADTQRDPGDRSNFTVYYRGHQDLVLRSAFPHLKWWPCHPVEKVFSAVAGYPRRYF